MTEVVVQSSRTSCTTNDVLYQHAHNDNNNVTIVSSTTLSPVVQEEEVGGERKRRRQEQEEAEERDYNNQLNNFVGLFLTAFRRSVLGCSSCEISKGGFSSSSSSGSSNCGGMEIGLPTNVRHVAHVTFDRFNGFLGLPVEFEPEVPRRAPSASATVFGVSTNSMQLSFDTRGNSVPTILLMMQHRLYSLGGLEAEGIFRINPDNGQEESVRDQLNRGLIPDDVDVHCLAGLIKAWFRELPTGILDCLSPEQVLESQTEEECTQLARLLPPTEAALLDWAINLMADVALFEHQNKMNARNVAMVFAPNMTHMADPLTALMHAVQVMNFLKTLIEKTLREREDSMIDSALDSYGTGPSGENGQQSSLHLQTILEESMEPDAEEDKDARAVNPCAAAAGQPHLNQDDSSIENIAPGENQSSVSNCKDDQSTQDDDSRASKTKDSKTTAAESEGAKPRNLKSCRSGQTSTTKKGPQKNNGKPVVLMAKSAQKTKENSLVNTMNLRTDRIEAWR